VGFVLNLATNLLANVVFWLGLGVTVWLGARLIRRRFFRFFGLRRDGQFTVHLSNLWDPASRGNTAGYTISMHELRATQSGEQLFGSATMRMPEAVRGLVDSVWLRQISRPELVVSPLDPSKVSLATSSIVVGGASRNVIRATYFDSAMLFLGSEDEEIGKRSYDSHLAGFPVRVYRGQRAGEEIRTSLNPAILEKIYDASRDITLFFCLGLRGDGSWAAVEYLVRNWMVLRREFGDRDFALCLGFPASSTYLERYVEPARLAVVVG